MKTTLNFYFVLIFAIVFFACPVDGSAGTRELKIKAGFLYNFSKYVEWPNASFLDDKSPLNFCIIDHEDFAKIVEKSLEGKKTRGRVIFTQLKKEADGSVVLYLQKESPGKDLEPNWLPAPDGPFYTVMRLYGPRPSVLEGNWTPPALERIN